MFKFFRSLRRALIGRPLRTQELITEKLPAWKALAIFSSDALSSIAYGPEQIMLILLASGMLAAQYMWYIVLAILLLLATLTISYAQIGKANPEGGGSYAIARKNLGELPALITAAALFTDYTLTVAVSISEGTAALTSAFPSLAAHNVIIDLFVLFGILMLFNLRGVREASTAFVFPTYAFILGIMLMIVAGIFKLLTEGVPVAVPTAEAAGPSLNAVAVLILLHAFANGCSSMTGIEAISNGIPMFREPSVQRATRTTFVMSSLLGIMFLGISVLAMNYHIQPRPEETVLSMIASSIFGNNLPYYYIQFTTMLILYLAANTSFNGLPPLLSILAQDGYLPRYMGERGERLSFSNGIIFLSFAAGSLIVIYGGDTEHLIALYALGVFLAFTIAQAALVKHWYTIKGKYWQLRCALNFFGTCVTVVVVAIIAVSKFESGAWMILIFLPTMIFIFRKIKGHYAEVAAGLRMSPHDFIATQEDGVSWRNIVIVPISGPTKMLAHTLGYARAIGDEVRAVNIAVNEEHGEKTADFWRECHLDIPLVTIPSPYRLLLQPLIAYIEETLAEAPSATYITVLIPEFIPDKFWQRFLHNQTGLLLRMLLIWKRNVIVCTVPYRLTNNGKMFKEN